MTKATTAIMGTVRRSTGSSILLDERDEALVVSRYYKNPPKLETGDRVRLNLDNREFIVGAELLNGGGETPEPAPMRGGADDLRAIRSTCIQSASAFCASRPELKSVDLFQLAERMEAWVLR